MYGTDVIDAYLMSMRAEGKSLKTISTYRRILRSFGRFQFSRDSSILNTTEPDLVAFRCSCRDALLAQRTQTLYAVVLRTFFGWLSDQERIASNPAKKLRVKTAIQSVAIPPSRDDFDRLVESIPRRTVFDFRDRAIFLVLFSSGLRISEMCSLRAHSIDLVTGDFSVVGKGSRRRVCMIGSRALDALREYVEDWRPSLVGADEPASPLWLSQRGAALTPNKLREMMQRRRIAAGIDSTREYASGWHKGTLTPHSIRALHATTMMQQGAPLPVIQASLGHSSLHTTQIYLSVSTDDLRASRALLDRAA